MGPKASMNASGDCPFVESPPNHQECKTIIKPRTFIHIAPKRASIKSNLVLTFRDKVPMASSIRTPASKIGISRILSKWVAGEACVWEAWFGSARDHTNIYSVYIKRIVWWNPRLFEFRRTSLVVGVESGMFRGVRLAVSIDLWYVVYYYM